MSNLSVEEIHNEECECDKCIEQSYQQEFEKLECGGCGWCTDCFELFKQI